MPDTAAVNLTHQTLFRSEYEQELESWLRRRFRAVCTFYIVLGALLLTYRLLAISFGDDDQRTAAMIFTLGGAAGSLGVVAYFLFGRHWTDATREELLRGATLMILLLGSISLLRSALVETLTEQESEFLLPLFFWHFIACVFLPWTPRESLRPIIPLLVLWALGVLFVESGEFAWRMLRVMLSPIILIPGLGICALRLQRHSEKFRIRMVGKHFLSMRQEIARARSIHESMFPAPHDDGYVRFDYTYTPMRELGGDYVHLDISPEGLVHLTLIDVTGHGLAAALTVNRLYGELERIRAEMPHAKPGDVLALLNRYIHLTLVKHNIYASALCMTLDPYLGKLHWANAGHPPAFLRGVNGVVTPMPATAVLLGALSPEEFTAEQRTMELSPGDVLVSYTDGAFESRNRKGEMLGLDRLNQMMRLQPPPRHWPQFIAAAVNKHSAGRPEDDILIASLTYLAPRQQTTHAPRSLTTR